MQNKPNFRKPQINLNEVLTRDYENMPLCIPPKTNPNKPKQTQFPPQKPASTPKTNPIKPNFKPIIQRAIGRSKIEKTLQAPEVGELVGTLSKMNGEGGIRTPSSTSPKRALISFFSSIICNSLCGQL
jgi:hypothetical protein